MDSWRLSQCGVASPPCGAGREGRREDGARGRVRDDGHEDNIAGQGILGSGLGVDVGVSSLSQPPMEKN